MPPLSRSRLNPISQAPRLIALVFAGYAVQASAQTAPDAGRLLQQQPQLPAAAPATTGVPTPSAPEAAPAAKGPKVLVKGFRIKGAKLISEAELLGPLQPAVNKELTLDQLRAAALVVTTSYLQKGYLARVTLPPQEVRDGIIELQVVEGQRGSISVENAGKRVDAARAQGFVEQRFSAGAPMSFADLGEAMNILNEQPGVEAKVSLAPGESEGAVNLNLKTADRPLATYTASANNYGSYGTGQLQGTASATLHNPTGNFDQASVLVNESEGSHYLRADYSLAVGESGLRLGVNAGGLDYRLVPSEFDALDAEGSARMVGLAASYPLHRHSDRSLSLSAGYDHSKLVDETLAGETGDRRVDAYRLGLGGHAFSQRLGGGVATFGANYVFGDVDQRNDATRDADRVSRRVQGSFDKIAYDLGWTTGLPYELNLTAALSGQLTRKNLDSSQQLILGGPFGLRAYPVGEAAGDQGWLFKLDLSKPVAQALTARVFYDLGSVRLNHNTWDNWDAADKDRENRYTLSGVGVGMDWRVMPDLMLNATVANPIGSNPGADANDDDVDGHDNRTRVWLGVNAQF